MAAEPSVEKVNILLVDDRPPNLTALCGMIERPDYNLVTATSGREALKHILRQDFALILLDVAMPGMDGFEVARIVKERERSKNTPIIFVTASIEDMSHTVQGYTAGGVDYLVKPLRHELVRAKVGVFVDLYRKTEEIRRQAERLREMERREHARAVAEAHEEAQRWLQFLADAGDALSSSLDYEKTVRDVAHLAVPALGDYCIIDILPPGHDPPKIHRLAWAHAEPAGQALLDRSPRPQFSETSEHPVPRALRTGLPALVPRIGDEDYAQLAETPEQAELMRGLGVRSLIVVPMTARGKTLGAIVLGRVRAGMEFGARDLSRATDLARRVGLALDNAFLYRDARAAIAARDEFLSIAAHELRTPLTALHLQTQALGRALERKGEQDPRLSNAREVLSRQTERLSRLIDELLDVSRAASGRLPIQPEEVDLAALVREVVHRFEPEARRQASAVELRVEGEAVGRWDRLRLDQVLTNLISNALKYGHGEPVAVLLQGGPDTVRLEVTDQGIGIAPEHQKVIFERFGRAVSSRSYGGLGLGLYITREIVLGHGGKISVHSELGRGTTFVVELPLKNP